MGTLSTRRRPYQRHSLCDCKLLSEPSFEALSGASLECYQLVVGGVSLAGVGADIHHLLPHRLVHVRVANHRVAVDHWFHRFLLLHNVQVARFRCAEEVEPGQGWSWSSPGYLFLATAPCSE